VFSQGGQQRKNRAAGYIIFTTKENCCLAEYIQNFYKLADFLDFFQSWSSSFGPEKCDFNRNFNN